MGDILNKLHWLIVGAIFLWVAVLAIMEVLK